MTTFTNTGLTPSTEYRYRVRSFNDVPGFTFYTNVAIATTPMVPGAAPAAPSNLTGTLSGNVATLTWTDNSNNEDKFILQSPGYNGGWTTVKEVPANQTTTTAYVRSASVNRFRVIARNAAGGDSEPSNFFDIATRPDEPIYPHAQAASSSAIDLSWDSNDSCQFHVEKLVNGQWVRIAQDLLALNFRDTGLSPGTAYSYRIIAAAVNSAGESNPSDVVTATTAPAAVTGLAVTGVTSSSVSLRWDNAVGEAGFLIERSLDGQNWTFVAMTYADVTTYTNTGLQSHTSYYFRVTGFAYGPVPGDRNDPVLATTT